MRKSLSFEGRDINESGIAVLSVLPDRAKNTLQTRPNPKPVILKILAYMWLIFGEFYGLRRYEVVCQ